MSTQNTPTNKDGPAETLRSGDLVRRLREHAQKLAGQLAECAGYLASVRTDRQITHHEELFALQTVEWAEGAAEIAEKSNALLEEHDSLDLDAFLAECGQHMQAVALQRQADAEWGDDAPPNNPAQTPEGQRPAGCL